MTIFSYFHGSMFQGIQTKYLKRTLETTPYKSDRLNPQDHMYKITVLENAIVELIIHLKLVV